MENNLDTSVQNSDSSPVASQSVQGSVTHIGQEAALCMILRGAFSIEMNANDFYHYASACSTSVSVDDIWWMIPMVQKYGNAGIDACVAYVQNFAPIQPHQNDRFLKAISELQERNQEVYGDHDYGDNYAYHLSTYRTVKHHSIENDKRSVATEDATPDKADNPTLTNQNK
jgi:hypothetical protein